MLLSYHWSLLVAACWVIFWNMPCKEEPKDQISSETNMTMKESSVPEIIPRGPFTSNGLFHDANPKYPLLKPIINQSYIVWSGTICNIQYSFSFLFLFFHNQ